MTSTSLDRYITAIPKVELHVHLEGSVQADTLLALAQRNRVELPVKTACEMRQWYAFKDFYHFNEVYNATTRCLQTAEDYELVVYELGVELSRQGVTYAEVSFSPAMQKWIAGVDEAVYMDGLNRGRRKVMQDLGLKLHWIFDLIRDSRRWKEMAEYATAVAIDAAADGVVAIGLGGLDRYGPPEEFEPFFDRARSAGLGSVPHAGEFSGPEHVWSTIHSLKPDRLCHGVTAIDDPRLVSHLAETGIPLDLCPTSNWCLGAVPSGDHPLRSLHEAGVIVTVSTDDPAMFGTSLTDELRLLNTPLGFGLDEIDAILKNSIDVALLVDVDKVQLRTDFAAASQRLKDDLDLNAVRGS